MNELEWLLLASILHSWLVASMVLRWAEHWQLVQSPNHRSSHVLPTPNGGGLGIVVATLVAGAWLAWSGANQLWSVLALSLPLAWVGFLDDVRHCRPNGGLLCRWLWWLVYWRRWVAYRL